MLISDFIGKLEEYKRQYGNIDIACVYPIDPDYGIGLITDDFMKIKDADDFYKTEVKVTTEKLLVIGE